MSGQGRYQGKGNYHGGRGSGRSSRPNNKKKIIIIVVLVVIVWR